MIALVRLVAAASIVVATAGSGMSQDAPRATPESAPTGHSAGTPGDKAGQRGEHEEQGKVEADGGKDAPSAGSSGCPYIKRKLELIV